MRLMKVGVFKAHAIGRKRDAVTKGFEVFAPKRWRSFCRTQVIYGGCDAAIETLPKLIKFSFSGLDYALRIMVRMDVILVLFSGG
jgi:hypothetical protein